MIRRVPTTFHRATVALTARFRWCLSGTPIQNTLNDLGALLVFTQIRPFDNMSIFRSFIANPFEDVTRKKHGIERLATLLDALCLRRTIDTVDVPGQRERMREIEFTPEERCQYDTIKLKMNKAIAQQANERWSRHSISGLFQVYLQLRILCNHGTYQHQFSWAKLGDLLDAEEDAVCSLTRDSYNRCSACREPLPVLLRDRALNYVERCKHIFCKSCAEETVREPSSNSLRHCPICEPTGGPPIPLQFDYHAPQAWSTSRENRRSDYFQQTGRSSKIETLVWDLQEDLEVTKRWVHPGEGSLSTTNA